MRDLTEEELNKLVSDKVADYENEISLFVPLTSDEPVIMYTSISSGMTSMHYLSVDIKRKYTGGLYVYSPKKPFDISEHEFSDFNWSINQISGDFIEFYNHETYTDDGYAELFQVSKMEAIAIAKALGVTGEDLL